MFKVGIRFKLILFTSLLMVIIGTGSSWFFFTQTRKQLDEELKKRGCYLIAQLAQDGEVKDSMIVAQKTFFDEPIRRIRNLDIEHELAYWRVSLVPDEILLEKKRPGSRQILIKYQYTKALRIPKKPNSVLSIQIIVNLCTTSSFLFTKNAQLLKRNLPHRFLI